MIEVQQKLRAFINENFLFGQGTDDLSDTDSLIDGGVIDSTGILQLVAFVEQEFGIHVQDDEFIPQNLDSVAMISAFVESKREPEQTAPDSTVLPEAPAVLATADLYDATNR